MPSPHIVRRSSFLLSCAALCAVMLARPVAAADWPCYGHDSARSNVTAENLPLPLTEQWHYTPTGAPRPAWGEPKPTPVEGYRELPRLKFDDAYYAVCAGGMVYFACAAENKVYALDAATGRERWSFFTEAPPRLAPAVSDGRVFFGADDGFVYCLDAATGGLVWRFQAAPTDLRVLGNERLISLWPVRTGVLVDHGIVYFGAGVFPGERVFLYALKAADGTVIWKNDTISDKNAGQYSFIPQGYLLAGAHRLYAPTGRTMPALFDRATGKLVAWRNIGKGTAMVGGTYALVEGDHLYTGTQEITGVDDQGAGKLAWFRGRRLLLTEAKYFVLTDTGLTALNRKTYPQLSRQRKGLEVRRAQLASLAAREKDPQRKKALKQQLAQVTKDLDKTNKGIAETSVAPWQLKHHGLQSLILAGDTLFAGGYNEVLAVDRATGKVRWTGQVEGVAKGLAAAGGRLLVSTDQGATYCFAAGGKSRGETAPSKQPLPQDEITKLCSAAAEEIVEATGVVKGYCLVWGNGTGRLAAELAKRTRLTIYGIDDNAGNVAAARRALNAAGWYGTRVCVSRQDLTRVPYADYFANLIVSETALTTGKIPGSAQEAFRMLKPCGGVLYLGQPARTGITVPALPPAVVRDWLAAADLDGFQPHTEGTWTELVRGTLIGVGNWTHQYATPANIASTGDHAVQCPLGVLWFGKPGPKEVVSRHQGAAAPLVVNGRVFLQGEEGDRTGKSVFMGFDAYNGVSLWKRLIPGAHRAGMVTECSNMAADDFFLYVAAGTHCFRLDGETGETTATYDVPPAKDRTPHRWAYVAVADDLLFGSTATGGAYSDTVFAVDPHTGDLLWVHRGKSIKNNTIAVSEGRVFFADSAVTPGQRRDALQVRLQELMRRKRIDVVAAEKELASADVRLVVALDARTGKVVWKKPVDLTDCGANVLCAMCQQGVLVFCGAHHDGHFWPQFLGGEYAARSIVALATSDGRLLWRKPVGYRIRPLIIGDTIYAEPWAFDLRTGKQRMRVHPVTGRPSPWQFERPGHHCGTVSGSPNALFFRSWSIAYYDLLADQGTNHFAGQRPGCWINIIPANGLVVVPEGSSGCMCAFPLQTTIVFEHRKPLKAWGIFSTNGPVLPVKDLCVNLGAPGDRRGADGKEWLSFPRPYSRMPVKLTLGISTYPGFPTRRCGYFVRPAEYTPMTGSDVPWLYASGSYGIRRCTVPVLGEGDGTALFTVRLGFAEADPVKPGQRVFDIKLQGKVVAKDFDIVSAAGGLHKAVVKEFTGIQANRNVIIEFVPKHTPPGPLEVPLLNMVEVVRERTLHVGIVVPPLVLSDVDPRQTVTIRLANNTDKPFVGVARIRVPEGFAVAPAETPVNLAPAQRSQFQVQVTLKRSGAPETHHVEVALVRPGGQVDVAETATLEYLGPRHRTIIPASEDAYVNAGRPTVNFGHATTLLVDGGGAAFGDSSYNLAYVRFPLAVPGRIVSAKLRLHTSPAEGSESGDSGDIRLVDTPWDEYELTFNNRPKSDRIVGKIGRVVRDAWVECPLTVDLTGKQEVSFLLNPTTTDGANYYAREGGQAPQLVIESIR